MSELEDKLGAILSNPEMMKQIMSLAQTMGQAESSAAPQAPPSETESPAWTPNLDLGTLQTISQFARGSKVDAHQQALLQALTPYLSHNRVEKLERAMRAAKMAGLASSLLSSGALDSLLGR